MKYTAEYKWKEVEFNYEPTYEPMDFIRNNDHIDLFTIENWKPKIDMETVIFLMKMCYSQMLRENYL
jgi:hypothetical protein